MSPKRVVSSDKTPKDGVQELQEAIAAVRAGGGVVVRINRPRHDGEDLEDVWKMSKRQEDIEPAVTGLALAYNEHVQRSKDASNRALIVKQLDKVEQYARVLKNQLERLDPAAQKALMRAFGPVPHLSELDNGTVVTLATPREITTVRQARRFSSGVPLAWRLAIYENGAKLAKAALPGGSGGRGGKNFRLEHGSAEGQLVVGLMDLMFPAVLRHREPSSTMTGKFHKAVLSVAVYATGKKSLHRDFGTQVEEAARLHKRRSGLINEASARLSRWHTRREAQGKMDEKSARLFALVCQRQTERAAGIKEKLRTL
jgi:hypothetical protein